MLDLLASEAAQGIFASGFAADQAVSMDLGRGAIAGALFVAAAYLAGVAAVKRSGVALCAFFVVALAAALQFSWLGFLPSLPPEASIFLLGLFAAAAVIFLSATISAAKYNPIIGGAMFAAALVLCSMAAVNFLGRVDLSGLVRWGAYGVGGFGIVLALTQALRGDHGARMILPGLAIAAAAPLVSALGLVDAGSLLTQGLFTLGVIAASLVALTDAAPVKAAPAAPVGDIFDAAAQEPEPARAMSSSEQIPAERERAEIVIDSQLGRVLDYSGMSIWDWSHDVIDQTDSLMELLGLSAETQLTPEGLRSLLSKESKKKFDAEIAQPKDGAFDFIADLKTGKRLRIRGARAGTVSGDGVERIVAFMETAIDAVPGAEKSAAKVAAATAAAVVPAIAGKSAPFDVGEVVAAFQPIVTLPGRKIVGYEALARLKGQKSGGGAMIAARADATGTSPELAAAMLEQSAKFLAERMSEARGRKDAPFVAMNVSWSQMRDAGFISAVEAAFKEHRLPKGALVLELTEGEAVSDAAAAKPVFSRLKKAGAELAFDDFGAGFSCLGNVRQYDFDYIKIDKSFAADLEANGDGAKIVEALAGMGKGLGLKVIVEGIESDRAASIAAKLGCAYGQGFALGRPEAAAMEPAPKTEDGGAKAEAVKTVDEADAGKEALKTANDEAADGEQEDAADEALELTADMAAQGEAQEAASEANRWKPWRSARMR